MLRPWGRMYSVQAARTGHKRDLPSLPCLAASGHPGLDQYVCLPGGLPSGLPAQPTGGGIAVGDLLGDQLGNWPNEGRSWP